MLSRSPESNASGPPRTWPYLSPPNYIIINHINNGVIGLQSCACWGKWPNKESRQWRVWAMIVFHGGPRGIGSSDGDERKWWWLSVNNAETSVLPFLEYCIFIIRMCGFVFIYNVLCIAITNCCSTGIEKINDYPLALAKNWSKNCPFSTRFLDFGFCFISGSQKSFVSSNNMALALHAFGQHMQDFSLNPHRRKLYDAPIHTKQSTISVLHQFDGRELHRYLWESVQKLAFPIDLHLQWKIYLFWNL